MEFEQGLRKRGAKPKSCVYVSTPITTGPLTLSGEMALDDLIEANVRHARQIVARAEEHFGGVVIDPTEFEDVEGWEQPDYHSFWLEIIEVYVSEIVFCSGWEYSTGCSIEFLCALELDLPRRDEEFTPLTDLHAISLLSGAIDSLEAANRSSRAQHEARDFLAARLNGS